MLTVLSDGDSKYRLQLVNGTLVSWINGRAITLRGFATERAARDAAIAGWQALGETLRQEYAGWPEHVVATERLRIVHDGAYEWFYDGTTAIARLLRPLRSAVDGTLGIQFLLPTYATDGIVITAAQNTAAAVAARQAATGAAPPRLMVVAGQKGATGRRHVPFPPDGNDAA